MVKWHSAMLIGIGEQANSKAKPSSWARVVNIDIRSGEVNEMKIKLYYAK